ncbi:MAG: FAD-dependent oxidoreductase [Alphaproteobacteria bacterium]
MIWPLIILRRQNVFERTSSVTNSQTNNSTENTQFENAFAPLPVGQTSLKNRFIMGSMHTGLEDRKKNFDRLAAYYVERAKGGVAAIITGGFAPNHVGTIAPFAGKLTNKGEVKAHKKLTAPVQAAGAKIFMQILHAGRYAYHPFNVGPSPLQAPINRFKPKELSGRGVKSQISDFVRCAVLAKEAGYDGVEIMGSEGYLINQFLSERTNKRTDQWGGSLDNRMRFALEIIRQTREAVGADFILVYRLSMVDLVEDGMVWDEVVTMAKAVEEAGASMINSGIGWHEARIPTISTAVPRGSFVWASANLKPHVSIPVIAANRINTPELVEEIVAGGKADAVSMARPFLADPEFVNKAKAQKSNLINTCIGCNQACLDQIFSGKTCSCLVNPRACRETELNFPVSAKMRRVGIIGAGPAGMAAACYARERGHQVVLFEQSAEIGGQFNMAKIIAGKEEFHETLRYFDNRLKELEVEVQLGKKVSAEDLMDFDDVIVATGVLPRIPNIEGLDHPKVLTYVEVLAGKAKVGQNVVVIGSGGIGMDTSTFLLEEPWQTPQEYADFWGIDTSVTVSGGLKSKGEGSDTHESNGRKIQIVQRSGGKIGRGLGKTTVWAHREALKRHGLGIVRNAEFLKVDDGGLHIKVDEVPQCLEADSIILCVGQESFDPITERLQSLSYDGKVHRIGGALNASGLDAHRAIKEAAELVSSEF